MIHSLHTALLFALTVFTSILCGYGFVRVVLPRELSQYRFVLAPTVGYAVLCWSAFTISGSFGIPLSPTIWGCFIILAAASVWTGLIGSRRERPVDVLRGLRHLVLLSAPMILITLLPMIYIGADTYLGTVNTDFFYQFADNHLVSNGTAVTLGTPSNTWAPFEFFSQTSLASARFIGEFWAPLLEKVLAIHGRTALTLTIALFLFALPSSLYFMCRAGFGLDERTSFATALLSGVSGPISVSYIHFLVGQNSALPVGPVLMTALFILITRPCGKSLVFAAVMFCSMLWMYAVMLPYFVLPAGLLACWLVATRKAAFTTLLKTCAAFCVLVLVANVGLAGFIRHWATAWLHLLGRTSQGQFFQEYITEQFFPLFFGLISYTANASLLKTWLGPLFPTFLIVGTVLVGTGLLYISFRWAAMGWRSTHTALYLCATIVCSGSWFFYTFERQYGYGLFKMASWLQFLVLPLGAALLVRFWNLGKPRFPRDAALAMAACLFVGCNVITAIDYGLKTIRQDPEHCGMMSAFHVSGNPDYAELERAVPNYVRPRGSVGLALTDSLQNNWAAYYLRGLPLSILSHPNPPTNEERLPDISTRQVRGANGLMHFDDNPHLHDTPDTYYLLTNQGINPDIVDQTLPAPVWKNGTFRLVRSAGTPALLVTGRGYYRVTYTSPPKDYWWPRVYRWSAEGGEFYLVRPSGGKGAFRLSLNCIAGFGLPDARRTLEFWSGHTKFDEIAINGNARVVTAEFRPACDLERIVFRVRERVSAIPRRAGLWNTWVADDYRELNLAVASARLLRSGELPAAAPVGAQLKYADVFEQAYAFDGIELNGWLRREATVTFVRPAAASSIEFRFRVPARPEFRFPYSILVEAGGHHEIVRVEQPGAATFVISLPADDGSHLITFRFRPEKAFTPAGYNQAIRPVDQTVLLEYVKFRAG